MISEHFWRSKEPGLLALIFFQTFHLGKQQFF